MNSQIWEQLANADVKLLVDKGKTYGDSWKKRGGVGAFMMLARKWDRIEKAAREENFDIFAAIDNVDELIDDIVDLRCYLLLCQAENQLGAEPEPHGYVNQDGDPWHSMAVDQTTKEKQILEKYSIELQDKYTMTEHFNLVIDIESWERDIDSNLPTRSFTTLMLRHQCVASFVHPTTNERIKMPLREDELCSMCEEDRM